MATTYTYRCADCGYERDVKFQYRPPEILSWDEHPSGPPETASSRVLCQGTLKRVWGNTRTNLGYRPLKHTKPEQWLFTNG